MLLVNGNSPSPTTINLIYRCDQTEFYFPCFLSLSVRKQAFFSFRASIRNSPSCDFLPDSILQYQVKRVSRFSAILEYIHCSNLIIDKIHQFLMIHNVLGIIFIFNLDIFYVDYAARFLFFFENICGKG